MNEELSPPGPLAPGGLRVTALGGINEIGRNMTVFEHLGRLLIIDCGGVLFPNHDEPGVDLILPDLRHISDRLDDIEALVLTHAHEDHIGAIPYLLKMRGDIPVVAPSSPSPWWPRSAVSTGSTPCSSRSPRVSAAATGCSNVSTSRSTTPSPDALAIAIHTGAGTVLHTGDIKLDQLPPDGRPTDLPGMSRLGDAGGVDLFLCDSTNSEIPGVGPSESEVGPNLHRLMRNAEGQRIIVACFASNVDRVQQIVDAAIALGRRVSFVGRSMLRNMAIARELGFLHVEDRDVVDIAMAEEMTPGQVVLITTGTQGEPMAALSRMSRGEHRSITITSDDLIILSSSLIPRQRGGGLRCHRRPGQDRRQGGHQSTSASPCFGPCLCRRAAVSLQRGAAAQRDAGTRHLADAARQRQARRAQWRARGEYRGGRERRQRRSGRWTGVDRRRGAGGQDVRRRLIMGDVGEATLGERLILSSGFIAATVVLNRETGRSVAAPQLHSRGFSEDPKALEPAARKVEAELEKLAAENVTDPVRVAQAVRRTIGKWVGETYRRQPMIVPTVIEI